MTKKLISTKEAADILSVSDQTIINWWREGYFPNAKKLNPKKRNSPIRIPFEDVEKARKAQRYAVAG